MSSPSIGVPLLDDLDGTRHHDVHLSAERIVKLGCGCQRWECRRPDGSPVHVLVGAHCERQTQTSVSA